MVRVLFVKDIDGAQGDVYYKRIAGNSEDTKPTTNTATGSSFVEADTGKKYVYNETSGEWTESRNAEWEGGL